MPTYTYRCRACEEDLEVVRSFADDPLTECPACAGELRQVFKPAGIVFKGEGWHIKDYAKKGAPAGDGGTNGSSGGTSGNGAGASGDGGASSTGTTSTGSTSSSGTSSSSTSSNSTGT